MYQDFIYEIILIEYFKFKLCIFFLVYGGWFMWGFWSECFVMCDIGVVMCMCICDSFCFLFGGWECEGFVIDIRDCIVNK